MGNQIAELVKKGCINPLCELVTAPDVRVVAVSLEGLENILKTGEPLKVHNNHVNPFADIIEKCNGLARIESLVNHPSVPIYEKARNLIAQYFSNEEDQSIQPETSGNTFNFNTSAPTGGFTF